MYALIVLIGINSYGVGRWSVEETGFETIKECEVFMEQNYDSFRAFTQADNKIHFNCDTLKDVK